MGMQNLEIKNQMIRDKFKDLLKEKGKTGDRLKLSWSNWGFGLEPIELSVERLAKNNLKYIELHGNLYEKDLGYKSKDINKLLSQYGMKVSGICGMFSTENELASASPYIRQRAIDYIKRNAAFGSEVGAEYFLILPGAVGRSVKHDDFEFERSVEALKVVSDVFAENNIKGAVEPIRVDEVSLCHTFKDAIEFIKAVDCPGIKHINGDVYHMLHGESHIGETLLEYGDSIVNIHLADTNRMALGSAMFDLDTFIMALYLIGYNERNAFCSAEPLGPGSDPYQQMNGLNDPGMLDSLVSETVSYFNSREEAVLNPGT